MYALTLLKLCVKVLKLCVDIAEVNVNHVEVVRKKGETICIYC